MVQPVLVVLLLLAGAGYVALHSPLRQAVARLAGTSSAECSFLCASSLTVERALEAGSAVIVLLVAALAARMTTQNLRGTGGDRVLGFGIAWLALGVVPAAYVAGLGQILSVPLLRPPIGTLLVTVPSIVIAVALTRSGARLSLPRASPLSPRLLLLWMTFLAVVLAAAFLTVRLTHPTSSYDALAYHAPLGAWLWWRGDLASFLLVDPEYNALAHPAVAELWTGLLEIAAGGSLADLAQLPFALLGAMGVATFARRSGLPNTMSAVTGIAFLTVPMVAAQMGTRLNDVVAAGLLVAVAALLAAPVATWDRRRILLAVLGMALLTTTKLALLPAVAALAIVLAVGLLRDGAWATPGRPPAHADRVPAAGLLALAGGLFLAVVAPWWLRNAVLFGNPVFPASLPFLGGGLDQTQLAPKDGEFVPSPLAWPIYPLIEAHNEFSGLGPLVIVGLLGALVLLVRARPNRPLVIAGLVWALSLPLWWWLTRHEPRFLLGPAALLLAFAPWALLGIGRRLRTPGVAGFAAAAGVSVAITLGSAAGPLNDQPADDVAFYDSVWRVLPAALTLPRSEGLLWEYGCASTTYPALFPLMQDAGDGPQREVVPISCRASTEAIAERMAAHGVQFAYVMASADLVADVQARHPATRFDLVLGDTIDSGPLEGTRRLLYRLRGG